MSLPYVNEINQEVTYIQNFTGYNHNLRRAQELSSTMQFYDMQNMTGDYAPVLSTRSLRTLVKVLSNEPQALFAKDYVYYIAGGDIVWGSADVENFEVGRLSSVVTSSGRKQVADIGAYVLILPDKKVLNTNTHTISDATFTFENNTWERIIEGVSYITTGKLKLTPSTLQGDLLNYVESESEPSDTSVYWLNPNTNTVCQYNAAYGMWQQLANVFLRVEPVLNYGDQGAGTDANEWLAAFKAKINTLHDYDTINLRLDDYDGSYGPLGGDTLIFHVGDGFFTIAGLADEAFQTEFRATINFPDLAFITSLNNRVWGCSSDGREIYASKLGDPTQWYNYAGLSSDSYAVTVGSDGVFTGAIAYNNNVLFFKKDRLHKIMGSYPSNFQAAEYAVNGVASGCDRTLCVVNGYLFYMGEENVMIYDGSMPRSCSDEFGDLRFTTGVSGQQMNKYYLSTDDGTTIRQFVYDTEKWQWWKEDDSKMEEATTFFNNLYSIHYMLDDNEVWQHVLTKEVGSYEGTMDWFVETGDLGLNSPYQKYISKIQFRIAFSGTLYVEIAYNGGTFTRVLEKTSASLRSFNIPINVKRCDHFRLKMGGEGVAKIYSMGYNVETGSEIC